MKAAVMKDIVLTGATSGIGREAALRLDAAGHRLLLVGRNVARGEEPARKPSRARFVPGDLSTQNDIDARFAENTESARNRLRPFLTWAMRAPQRDRHPRSGRSRRRRRRQLLEIPAPVVADALSYHDKTTARLLNEGGGAWNRYAAGEHGK
jgi:NAD(P)-dependent dehydrogenase (short-subunit alcohol dehydrogenase family)